MCCWWPHLPRATEKSKSSIVSGPRTGKAIKNMGISPTDMGISHDFTMKIMGFSWFISIRQKMWAQLHGLKVLIFHSVRESASVQSGRGAMAGNYTFAIKSLWLSGTSFLRMKSPKWAAVADLRLVLYSPIHHRRRIGLLVKRCKKQCFSHRLPLQSMGIPGS